MNEEIKELIITSLNLEDTKPEDIGDSQALFGPDGFGLDSVDALELSLAIQKKYNLVLDANTVNLRDIFYSVDNLANFIASQLNK